MNWCCFRNSGGKTGCGRCAAFDLYLAGEAVCVCLGVCDDDRFTHLSTS